MLKDTDALLLEPGNDLRSNESVILEVQQQAQQTGLLGFVNGLLSNGLTVTAGPTPGYNNYANGNVLLDATLTGRELLGTFIHEAEHHFSLQVMQPAFNYAHQSQDYNYALALYAQLEGNAITREGLANVGDGRLGYGISRAEFNNIVRQTENMYRGYGITNPQAMGTFFEDVAAAVAQKILNGPPQIRQMFEQKALELVAPAPAPPVVSSEDLIEISTFAWDDENYNDGFTEGGAYDVGDSNYDGSVGDATGDGVFDFWNGYNDGSWYGLHRAGAGVYLQGNDLSEPTAPMPSIDWASLDLYRLSTVLLQAQAAFDPGSSATTSIPSHDRFAPRFELAASPS